MTAPLSFQVNSIPHLLKFLSLPPGQFPSNPWQPGRPPLNFTSTDVCGRPFYFFEILLNHQNLSLERL